MLKLSNNRLPLKKRFSWLFEQNASHFSKITILKHEAFALTLLIALHDGQTRSNLSESVLKVIVAPQVEVNQRLGNKQSAQQFIFSRLLFRS